MVGWAIYLNGPHISTKRHRRIEVVCSPSKLNQDRLHCVISAPVGKARQFGWIDDTISWVDTREIDLVDELDSGWFVWVLITAVHLQGVDSVLVNALSKMLLVPELEPV